VNTTTNTITFTVSPQATGGNFSNATVVQDSADYLWYLDYNEDGVINSADVAAFLNNLYGINGGHNTLAP
jgi:hypothetical protein